LEFVRNVWAVVTLIAHTVTIGVLLVFILYERTVVWGADIDRETRIAVSVPVAVGARVTGIAQSILIGVFLVGVLFVWAIV
jgi:hypothetical protein